MPLLSSSSSFLLFSSSHADAPVCIPALMCPASHLHPCWLRGCFLHSLQLLYKHISAHFPSIFVSCIWVHLFTVTE